METLERVISREESQILVCIPAYNEATCITDIIKKAANYASEVITYDDGSTDNAAEVSKAADATVIPNRKNKGFGAAIKTPFEAATEKGVDFMVTMDSDGQHDPDEIPRILERILNERVDIVIGSRF